MRNPGRPDEFTFVFDSSLINVTVYVTGFAPLTINLTDPSGGVSRSSGLLSQHGGVAHAFLSGLQE